MTSRREWKVALCVTPAKMAKLGWGDVSSVHTTRHRSKVFAVAPSDLSGLQNPPPDVLVFKLTDQFSAEDGSHDGASAREDIAHVAAWLAAHPTVAQVDPIAAQRRFARRDALCALLPRCGCVRAARHNVGSAEGLRFPVLCKPAAACGAAPAHVMTIAFGPRAVEQYAASAEAAGGFVCQEYVNHDARLFKVFCVGRRTIVQERPSLPNLRPWKKNNDGDEEDEEPQPLQFDNQKPVAPQIAAWPRVVPSNAAPRQVSLAELEEVAAGTRKAFGASLLGIDVIADADTGELVAIDANYFPSFRGCLDAAGFFDLVLDHVSETSS